MQLWVRNVNEKSYQLENESEVKIIFIQLTSLSCNLSVDSNIPKLNAEILSSLPAFLPAVIIKRICMKSNW